MFMIGDHWNVIGCNSLPFTIKTRVHLLFTIHSKLELEKNARHLIIFTSISQELKLE
jgi:hypothetical protein